MALSVGSTSKREQFFVANSEGDVIRVIGLVTEIAGPKTTAIPVENWGFTANREAAPMSLAEKQHCY